ncbi:MAG TPA: zf-TFIIB domain-containing protein [Labilithrix sp.]
MDITGRAHGWKGRDVRCPGCAEAMSVEPIEGGDVDLCGACGGIWIDWFDGDPRAIATKVVEAGLVGRPSAADALRAQEIAIGACPRCNVQLVAERLQASGSRLQATRVMRCEACAGCFVSREAAEEIAKEQT